MEPTLIVAHYECPEYHQLSAIDFKPAQGNTLDEAIKNFHEANGTQDRVIEIIELPF